MLEFGCLWAACPSLRSWQQGLAFRVCGYLACLTALMAGFGGFGPEGLGLPVLA